MLTLVSFDLCPYVQRAAIALAEKGVPFERRTVDLANRPDWFKAMSPLGKVPLLQGRRGRCCSRARRSSSISRRPKTPALHPADPLVRARHRAWMEFGSSILADIWTVETTPDARGVRGQRAGAARQVRAGSKAELGEGPYFAGAALQPGRRGLRAGVPLLRRLRPAASISARSTGTAEGAGRGARRWRRGPRCKGAVAADYEARLEAFLRREPSAVLLTRLRRAA